MQAALHPAQTSDLYFVADGTGGHAFSENLKDHNTAVQKWREVEKQRAKQADGTDGKPDDNSAPIPQAKPDAAAKDQARKGKALQQARKNAKAAQNQAPAGGGAAAGSGDGAAASDQASGATDTADVPLPVKKPKKQ